MRILFWLLFLRFFVQGSLRPYDPQYDPEMKMQQRLARADPNCPDPRGGGGGERGRGGDCGALLNSKDTPKEKATNIAQKAAAEAKAASDAQNDAANAASQQVKSQLAEKAAQAAKAAEAAMAGKQQMVEQLQNEIKEAEALRQQEEQAVQNAQNALNNAQAATVQANEQINAINVVMENAKLNLQSWEQVTNTAQQELAEKTQHHEVAKMRIEQLLRNLGSAREDLERTKQAACKAAMAAKKAAENAENRNPRNEKRQIWHKANNIGIGGNILGGQLQTRLGRRIRKRHRRPQYLEQRNAQTAELTNKRQQI